MKDKIHPTYYSESKVVCSCGNTWTTGSTHQALRTDVCFKCHPFFTGEQRIVDSAGQVDRFMKRLGHYSKHQTNATERQEYTKNKLEKQYLKQQLVAIDLSDEVIQALNSINVFTLGDLTQKVEQEQDSLLALKDLGAENLKDIQSKLQEAKSVYFAEV